jgi:hypothetical protein
MKSHFFANLKRFKILHLVLAVAFLFNSLGPAWAREGNFGNTTSLEAFSGGALAGLVTDVGILIGFAAGGPWGAVAAGAGSIASNVTGYMFYYYNYNQYAKPMFEVAGVTVTKGQFYSMVAGVVVASAVSYLSGALSAAEKAGEKTAGTAVEQGAATTAKTSVETVIAQGATSAANEGSKSWVSSVVKAAVSVYKKICAMLEAANNYFKGLFDSVAGVIKGVFGKVIDAVKATVKKISDSIKAVFKKIGNAFKGTAKEAAGGTVKAAAKGSSFWTKLVGKIKAIGNRFVGGFGMRSPYFQYGIEGSLKKAFVQLTVDMIVGTFKLWTTNAIKLKLEEAGWDELLAELVSQLGASIAGTFVNQIVSNLAFSALDAISDRAAANDKVKVTRQGPDGKVETVEMTIQELSQGKTAKGSSLQEAIAAGEIGELQLSGEKTLVLKIGESIYKIDIDMNKGSVYRSLMQYVGSYSLSAVGGALDQADVTRLEAVNNLTRLQVSLGVDKAGKPILISAKDFKDATISMQGGKSSTGDGIVANNVTLAELLNSGNGNITVTLNLADGKTIEYSNISAKSLLSAVKTVVGISQAAHQAAGDLLHDTGGLQLDTKGNTMSSFGVFNQGLKAVQSIGLAPFVNLGVKLAVLSAMGYKTHRGDDDNEIFKNLLQRTVAGSIGNIAAGLFVNIDPINNWYAGGTATNPWRTRGDLEGSRFVVKTLLENIADASLQIAWGQYCRVNHIRQPQALQELLHLASGVVVGSLIDAIFLRPSEKSSELILDVNGRARILTTEDKEESDAQRIKVPTCVVDGVTRIVLSDEGYFEVEDIAPKSEDSASEGEKKETKKTVYTKAEFRKSLGAQIESAEKGSMRVRLKVKMTDDDLMYYQVIGFNKETVTLVNETTGILYEQTLDQLVANVAEFGKGQALQQVGLVAGVLLGAANENGERKPLTQNEYNEQLRLGTLQRFELNGYVINGAQHLIMASTNDPLVKLSGTDGKIYYASASQIKERGGTAREEKTGEYVLDGDARVVYRIERDDRKTVDVYDENGSIVAKKEEGNVVLKPSSGETLELTGAQFRDRAQEKAKTVYELSVGGIKYSAEQMDNSFAQRDPYYDGKVDFGLRSIVSEYLPATLENLGDNLFLAMANATLFPVNLRSPINGMNGMQARFNEQERITQNMILRAKGYSPLQANRSLALEGLSQQAQSRAASSLSAMLINPALPFSNRTFTSFIPTGRLVDVEQQRLDELSAQLTRLQGDLETYSPDSAKTITKIKVDQEKIQEKINDKEAEKRKLQEHPVYAAYQALQERMEDPKQNKDEISIGPDAMLFVYAVLERGDNFSGTKEELKAIEDRAIEMAGIDQTQPVPFVSTEIQAFNAKVAGFVGKRGQEVKGVDTEIKGMTDSWSSKNTELQKVAEPRQRIFPWVLQAQGLTMVKSLPDGDKITLDEQQQGWAIRGSSICFLRPEGEDAWMQAKGLGIERTKEWVVAEQKRIAGMRGSGHGQTGGILHYQRRDVGVGVENGLNTNQSLFVRALSDDRNSLLTEQQRILMGTLLSNSDSNSRVVLQSTYSLSVAGGLPLDSVTYGRAAAMQVAMTAVREDMLKIKVDDPKLSDKFMEEQFAQVVDRMDIGLEEKKKLLDLKVEDKKDIIRKFSSEQPVFFSPSTSMLSRTRTDVLGRPTSTEYFGQEFTTDNTWSTVSVPKSTEYLYGPFGLALTRSVDYSAITPPEYEEVKSVVVEQPVPKAKPAVVEPQHVWQIKAPPLPETEYNRGLVNALFGKDKARRTQAVVDFIKKYGWHAFPIETIKKELYEPNEALMEELDPIVATVNEETARPGKSFSRQVTSWGAGLLYFLSDSDNYSLWSAMSERGKVEFVKKWTGFDRALGSAHTTAEMQDRVADDLSGAPLPGGSTSTYVSARVYDKGGKFATRPAPFDPGAQGPTDVFNANETNFVWLPVLRIGQDIAPALPPPDPEITSVIKPSGYTPVSVGPNVDYNLNFYSIGTDTPFNNPSFNLSYSDFRSGTALQPYFHFNSLMETAFINEKGERAFETALDTISRDKTKVPTLEAGIPEDLGKEIIEIAQSVVVDYEKYLKDNNIELSDQEQGKQVWHRRSFIDWNQQRANDKKSTVGELIANSRYMQSLRQAQAPVFSLQQFGFAEYRRLDSGKSVPLFKWGLTSGFRTGQDLQIAPAFNQVRQGVYSSEAVNNEIARAYSDCTRRIDYLREKRSDLQTLELKQAKLEQEGANIELEEIRSSINKIRKELSRWSDPVQEIATLEAARDRLLFMQPKEVGENIYFVQRPGNFGLGSVYQEDTAVMLPGWKLPDGQQSTFIMHDAGDMDMGNVWDYLKPKTETPDLNSPTVKTSTTTNSTDGGVVDSFDNN